MGARLKRYETLLLKGDLGLISVAANDDGSHPLLSKLGDKKNSRDHERTSSQASNSRGVLRKSEPPEMVEQN
jgi:hypothetical protein